MGKGGGTSTVTTTVPPEFIPYYKSLFKDAGSAYKQADHVNPYTGQMIAQGQSLEDQGLQAKAGLADQFQGLGTNLANLGQAQDKPTWKAPLRMPLATYML